MTRRPKQLTHHDGNVVTRAADEREKTAGRKCQTGNLTPGRLRMISMCGYTPGGNIPYDCGMVSEQPAARVGGGA